MSAPAPLAVHVVDDDASFRVALERLLGTAGYAVRTYPSAGAFLLAWADAPDGCLILDLHMPGPDGLMLFESLQQRGWNLPTVFLTGCGDIPSSVRALKAGALDFLTKPVQAEVLLEAVRVAMAESVRRRTEREAARLAAARWATLDARERTVFERVVQGRLTKQIADELGVSERTVKACRASMMRKLDARTLPDLVRVSIPTPIDGGSPTDGTDPRRTDGASSPAPRTARLPSMPP